MHIAAAAARAGISTIGCGASVRSRDPTAKGEMGLATGLADALVATPDQVPALHALGLHPMRLAALRAAAPGLRRSIRAAPGVIRAARGASSGAAALAAGSALVAACCGRAAAAAGARHHGLHAEAAIPWPRAEAAVQVQGLFGLVRLFYTFYPPQPPHSLIPALPLALHPALA